MGVTIYEDVNIIRLQYPNGVMTVDKNTGRMILWEGINIYQLNKEIQNGKA